MQLIKIFLMSVIAGLALPVFAATSTPTVQQLDQNTVVVSWQTDQPGSSRVEYTAQNLLVAETTPEYATHTTHHQMKISGLDVNVTYTFIGHATGDQGNSTTTSPVTFMLQPTNVLITPEPIPASQPFHFNLFGVIQSGFQAEQQGRTTVVSQLSDARAYALSQQGSILFVALAGILYCLILLAQEISWVLVVDWLIGLTAWQIWRRRKVSHSFKVRDGVTQKPIAGAQVSILNKANNALLRTFTSDVTGTVAFDWPNNEAVMVRVTHRGYQAATVTFGTEITDVMLTPLTAVVSSPGVIPLELKFQLRHSLKIIELTVLVVGSLLFVISLLRGITTLTVLSFLIYIYLWILYASYRPRRYHLAQVVDTLSQTPVPYAHVTIYRNNKAEQLMSNKQGVVYLPYPLPEFISLAKPGYVSVLRQSVPMSSISTDPLMLALQPKE